MLVYIKPAQKTIVTGRKIVFLKDVAEVFSPDKDENKIKDIPVFEVKEDKCKNYAVSVMDIIKRITNEYPSASVVNLGEGEVLIQFSPDKHKTNSIWNFIKIAFVSIVLFIGSGTAIMSFQADGELIKIMEGYYNMFYGTTKHSPWLLEIPYSLGIAIGITIFFNHFSRSKESKDPTPIEIQMTLYEQQTVTSMVDSIMNEKDGRDGHS